MAAHDKPKLTPCVKSQMSNTLVCNESHEMDFFHLELGTCIMKRWGNVSIEFGIPVFPLVRTVLELCVWRPTTMLTAFINIGVVLMWVSWDSELLSIVSCINDVDT